MSRSQPEQPAPPRLLLDLADGKLADDEVEALTALLRFDGPPPDDAALIARSVSRQLRATSPLARLVAVLRFDSATQPAFAGLRAAQAAARRVRFEVDDVEIDIEISRLTRSAVGMQVSGQVSSAGGEPGVGELRLSDSQRTWIVPFDAAGRFTIERVPPASYQLEVRVGDRVIETPALQL